MHYPASQKLYRSLSGQSLNAAPLPGQQGPVSVPHKLPRSLSNSSPSLSPTAAHSPGQQGPLNITPCSFSSSSASFDPSTTCSPVKKQDVVEQPPTENSLSSTSALQTFGLASNVSSDGGNSDCSKCGSVHCKADLMATVMERLQINLSADSAGALVPLTCRWEQMSTALLLHLLGSGSGASH